MFPRKPTEGLDSPFFFRNNSDSFMKSASKSADSTRTRSPREPLHRAHSAKVIDGADRAASRAMLHAVGFNTEDFRKSQIGIASTWSMVTPCNMHIDKLAVEAAHGADEAGGKSIIFNTITISDGISMGTEGMKYSLVSREVIADSIETVPRAKDSTPW